MTTSIPELDAVTTLVDENSECLLSANMDLKNTALQALKFVFDLSLQSETPSATSSLNQLILSMCSPKAPQTRSQRKRKRSPSPKLSFSHTPLSSLLVSDMDENQLWAQLELKNKPFCDLLDFVLESEPAGEGELGPGSVASLEDDDPDETFEEQYHLDSSDESSSEDGSLSSGGNSITQLRASSSDNEEEPLQEQGDLGLNDGFFDLNAFNAETEEAEARVVSSGHLGDGDESSDDEMSVDFFAPIDNLEIFEEEDLENNSGVFYKDFFEPTPKISQRRRSIVRFHDQVQVKKIKATGKNRPLSALDEEENSEGPLSHLLVDEGEHDEDEDEDEDDDDGHEKESASNNEIDDIGRRDTIESVKNDLFAEDAHEDPSLSTYERRQKAIQEEISALEAENTGKKEWMLMGEADSRSRPKNSLLEEDLDFEHVQKAVPVITQESIKSLEDRIKERILENRFDDVVRVRPVDDKPFLPSRFLELKDTKSTQSLSQIYEDEYTATVVNGAAVDDRDGKLKQEHEEIEKIWEQICSKLDALCNAHFVPKQPKAEVSSIGQVSAVSLESALPTTKSVAGLLAPEEIFSSSAQLRARSEMTPTEKRAARTKDRKAKQKARDTLNKSVDKYVKAQGGRLKKQKQAALRNVIKVGKGITVVGKERRGLGKKNPNS